MTYTILGLFKELHVTVCDMNISQFSSVSQSCPTLTDPIDYSTPGFPVHHQHLELAQTHVHGVDGTIQPCHSLLLPPQSFPASGSFLVNQFFHQVAKVWELQLQHQSFQ